MVCYRGQFQRQANLYESIILSSNFVMSAHVLAIGHVYYVRTHFALFLQGINFMLTDQEWAVFLPSECTFDSRPVPWENQSSNTYIIPGAIYY